MNDMVFHQLIEEAVRHSIELARPVEEPEVLQPLRDAGYTIAPEDTKLCLALYREAKDGNPRLWLADWYTAAERALSIENPESMRYFHYACMPVGFFCRAVFTDDLPKESRCAGCSGSIHIHFRSLQEGARRFGTLAHDDQEHL